MDIPSKYVEQAHMLLNAHIPDARKAEVRVKLKMAEKLADVRDDTVMYTGSVLDEAKQVIEKHRSVSSWVLPSNEYLF